MLDLTGANLISYLIRVVRDAVARNPRFRNTLGEVTFASNNQIFWKDTQITVNRISTQGTRLSFDYFICTQHGRALVAKVQDKEGTFIEWIREIDRTQVTPDAGTYYLNIDSVDEQTRDIGITVHRYKWREGKVTDAQGTVVYLADGIDGPTLKAFDSANGNTLIPTSNFAHFIYLLAPCKTVVLQKPDLSFLTPMTDYWLQREQDFVIIPSTKGGQELANIPVPFVSLTLVDQDDYQLRPNLDYQQMGPSWIQLSPFSPPGSTITAQCIVKLDPSITVATHPENIFQIDLASGETIAPGQVFIRATSGNYNNVSANPDDGTITLPTLLQPGEYASWEVHIDTGQFTAKGRKYELNGFKQTDAQGALVLDDQNNPVEAIPGLAIAVGDNVVVGDQCAIIVSPSTCETYEIYGSKENLSFTLECKANDIQTASDLSELLKQELLIFRRENMEADGVTIFECTRENRGQQRDQSGTAATYSFDLSITAAADWKVYMPVVTRVTDFEVSVGTVESDFLGKLQAAPRMQAFGKFQFIPHYA